MSTPAAATIPSCRSRCRSRRRPAAGSWCARGRRPTPCARRSPMRSSNLRAVATPPRSTSPSRPSRNGSCSAPAAISSAPTSSSTGRMPATTRFDAFLAALASRKRKAIRREREDALANGISVHWLTGSDLTESVWDAFFEFYMETGSRKWGRPYLTRSFYSLVGETMRDRILLVMAKRDGRWIAGAINFIGSDTLFGRHWGCVEQHPVPAFRDLLLPGDRLRHRAQARPRRGRRPGRAQDLARLYAGHDLFGALHRRPRAAARDRGFPQARASLRRRRRRRAGGRRRSARGKARDASQDPAKRNQAADGRRYW